MPDQPRPTKKQTLCQRFLRRVGAFYAPKIRCTITKTTLMTEDYLEQWAKRAKYEAVLAKVPDVEPEEYDKLDIVEIK